MGTGESPKCPVFIEGKKFTTLQGTHAELAADFQRLVDDYVETKYMKRQRGVREQGAEARQN